MKGLIKPTLEQIKSKLKNELKEIGFTDKESFNYCYVIVKQNYLMHKEMSKLIDNIFLERHEQ